MPWDEEADPQLASAALEATDALADAAQHLRGNAVDEPVPQAPVVALAAAQAKSMPMPQPGTGAAGLRKRSSAFAAARATRH
jgi:hypothetical protein